MSDEEGVIQLADFLGGFSSELTGYLLLIEMSLVIHIHIYIYICNYMCIYNYIYSVLIFNRVLCIYSVFCLIT